jgi:hypothetical protein
MRQGCIEPAFFPATTTVDKMMMMNFPPSKNWLMALAVGICVHAVAAENLAVGTNAAPLVTATNAVAGTNAPSAAEIAHQKEIHRTIEHLISLQMNSDAASLATLLAGMTNAEPLIRKAALNAVIQFNDRSAIPALQKIADATADPFEKVDILKAIDYIKLPSFTEYAAYMEARKKARHQTNSAPAVTNAPVAATNVPVVVHP